CETAVLHFERSRSVIASQPDALEEFGICLVRLKRPDAAAEVFRQLAGKDPDPKALALASGAYEALGDTPNAVSTLRQAIVGDPRNESYYLDFAALSFTHKSYEAGIQMVKAGLTLSPDSPKLHLARGILYVQIGHIDQADADFAASERLDPQQPSTAAARVLAHLQQNNMEEAQKAVQQEMSDRPNDG